MTYFDQLTPQQQAFVMHYVASWSTGAAARKAQVSSSTGSEWMKNHVILGAIDEQVEQRNQRLEIDADWVLMQLMQAFNADVAELYDEETNSLLPVHEWPEHWRKLTVGVKTRELFETQDGIRYSIGDVVDVKLPNKEKLIELLGKHIGVRAFTEQVSMAIDSDLANRLAKGRKRLNEFNARRAGSDPEDQDTGDSDEMNFL